MCNALRAERNAKRGSLVGDTQHPVLLLHGTGISQARQNEVAQLEKLDTARLVQETVDVKVCVAMCVWSSTGSPSTMT